MRGSDPSMAMCAGVKPRLASSEITDPIERPSSAASSRAAATTSSSIVRVVPAPRPHRGWLPRPAVRRRCLPQPVGADRHQRLRDRRGRRAERRAGRARSAPARRQPRGILDAPADLHGDGPWEQAWDRALLTLNQARQPLRKQLGVGLIVAAPPRVKPRIREAAPDIWSIRSLVIDLDEVVDHAAVVAAHADDAARASPQLPSASPSGPRAAAAAGDETDEARELVHLLRTAERRLAGGDAAEAVELAGAGGRCRRTARGSPGRRPGDDPARRGSVGRRRHRRGDGPHRAGRRSAGADSTTRCSLKPSGEQGSSRAHAETASERLAPSMSNSMCGAGCSPAIRTVAKLSVSSA